MQRELIIAGVALFSAFAGIVFDRWLRRYGRVRFHPLGWWITPQGQDASGGSIRVDIKEAGSATVACAIDAQNSKEEPASFRQVRFAIHNRKKRLFTIPAQIPDGDYLDVLKIPAKEMVHLELHGVVPIQQISHLRGADRSFLVMLDNRNRERSYRLSAIDWLESFTKRTR